MALYDAWLKSGDTEIPGLEQRIRDAGYDITQFSGDHIFPGVSKRFLMQLYLCSEHFRELFNTAKQLTGEKICLAHRVSFKDSKVTPLSLFDVRVYTRTPKYAFASVNLDDGTYADTERFWYDLEGNMIDFEIALSTIRAQDQVLATEERALANLDRVFGNWFQGGALPLDIIETIAAQLKDGK